MDNFVSIVGNVARDPELRYTPAGTPCASFGIAVNRRWQDRTTNEWVEQVSFFDVTAWRELADNVVETVSKGARVAVVGRLEQQTWEDKATGDKRSKVQIVADEVSPSLRWATADVTKNEKRTTATPPGGERPAAAAPKAGYAYDEEPF